VSTRRRDATRRDDATTARHRDSMTTCAPDGSALTSAAAFAGVVRSMERAAVALAFAFAKRAVDGWTLYALAPNHDAAMEAWMEVLYYGSP
jgi:hypothetical protein